MPLPQDDSFPTMYRDLLLHFLAEVLTVTHTAATPEAFQHALQRYCEELRPWVTPADLPTARRATFSLLADCTMDEETDLATVQLSPEGEAFFRAWVRRQSVLSQVGQAADPDVSH